MYAGVAPFRLLAETGESGTTVRRGRTLVAIFLRGGLDGLNFVVPYGDAAYYTHRKSIAIPKPGQGNGAMDLDGFFGLHPKAKALVPLFQGGQAIALQAVGYDRNTRSHFEEQDTWETGVIGNTIHSDGWLNRHLMTSQGHGPIRAITLGDSLPRILRGNAPAFAIRGIADLALPKTKTDDATLTAALEHAYCSDPREHMAPARDLVSQSGIVTLEGVRLIKQVSSQKYVPAAPYPEKNGVANQLRQVAQLIKADVGVEVAEIDYGGWDTHNQQGGVDGGYANRLQQLAEALAAFAADLGAKMDDVLVVTLSDFGRTVSENGTQGTDHGWANCMLAIGGPVLAAGASKPRFVLGKWPGLSEDQLYQKRDLRHTTDFRDVLGEVVHKHLGNPNLKDVLPQHRFKSVGLV